MGSIKHGIYLVAALGLLIYAIPRLEVGQGFSQSTVFSIVWLGMMLLIIAAHLHELLGVDEAKRKELERIRLYKRHQMQQWIENKVHAYRERKSSGEG